MDDEKIGELIARFYGGDASWVTDQGLPTADEIRVYAAGLSPEKRAKVREFLQRVDEELS